MTDKNNAATISKWSPFNFLKKKSNISIPNLSENQNGRKITLRDDKGRITGCVNIDELNLFGSPFTVNRNFITLFETVPEIAFPIRFIIDRIAGGNYYLKSSKDDSIVWDNPQINKFLSKPNPINSFHDFILSYFAYEYVTGNSFLFAATPDSFSLKNELWKWCDNYWVLPSDNVRIITPLNVPLFSTANINEIINYYCVNVNGSQLKISPENIMHSRDLNISMDSDYLKGKSRLCSQIMPISNLIAVYQARNVIYCKRGALGMLISKKYDDTGSLSITPEEKEEILKEYYKSYGFGEGKYPIGVVNVPAEFIRINMSIEELQPFDETLADACQIAGAYNVPPELIPRKDNSTFNNQNTAEIAVYSNVIIPRAKKFVSELTSFLGLDKSGLYIDVDFSHIDVLQNGFKEKQQTKSITSDKCRKEFFSGVITLNDWRAQIGESKVNNPLYDKLILEMNEEEINKISLVMNLNNTKNGNVQSNPV